MAGMSPTKGTATTTSAALKKQHRLPCHNAELVSQAEIITYKDKFVNAFKGLKMRMDEALFEEWSSKKYKVCDYCRRRGLACLIDSQRLATCKPCTALHYKCSWRRDFEIKRISLALDVSEAQCRRFHCAWGRGNRRWLTNTASGPAESESSSDEVDEGEEEEQSSSEEPSESPRHSQPPNPASSIHPTRPLPSLRSISDNRNPGKLLPFSRVTTAASKGVSSLPRYTVVPSTLKQPPSSETVRQRHALQAEWTSAPGPSFAASPAPEPTLPSIDSGSSFEVQMLRRRVKRLEADIVEAKRDHDNVRRELEDKNEDLQKAHSRVCRENETLQSKLAQILGVKEEEIEVHGNLKTTHANICAENEGLKTRLASVEAKWEKETKEHEMLRAAHEGIRAEHGGLKTQLAQLVKGQKEHIEEAVRKARSQNTNPSMVVDLSPGAKSSERHLNKQPADDSDTERQCPHKAFVLSLSDLTHFLASRIPPVANPSHSDLLSLSRRIHDILNRLIAEDFAKPWPQHILRSRRRRDWGEV